MTGGIPRPLINLTRENFAVFMDRAVGRKSNPRFDPYANSLNYLLASYYIPYVGLTGYVGTIPYLVYFNIKKVINYDCVYIFSQEKSNMVLLLFTDLYLKILATQKPYYIICIKTKSS